MEQTNNQERQKAEAIIVTFSGEDWLKPRLDSLRCRSMPIEIVVVDNAFGNQAISIAHKTPGLMIIETGENLDFGRAMNNENARTVGRFRRLLSVHRPRSKIDIH